MFEWLFVFFLIFIVVLETVHSHPLIVPDIVLSYLHN